MTIQQESSRLLSLMNSQGLGYHIYAYRLTKGVNGRCG